MRKNKYLLFLGLSISVFFFGGKEAVFSQEKKVDYGEEIIIDSDLDGLTDEGEKQIYLTNPNNPDSDRDGFLDGAEIIGKSNPSDSSEPKEQVISKTVSYEIEKETPWAWYLTRASALVSFLLLWISIFLGIAIRLPVLSRIFQPSFSVDTHGWISLQTLLFAAIHGGSLLFDKYIGFSVINILVPFSSLPENMPARIDSGALAMGIISFYLILALVISSYLRKIIPYWLWRGIHFLNIGLYLAGVAHALRLGTDLQEGLARAVFIGANIFLSILLVLSALNRVFAFLKMKRAQNKNENISESDASVV